MKIKVISVGKIKEKYLVSAIEEYLKRLTSYVKVDIIEIPDEKAPDNLSESQILQIKEREGEKILSKIYQDDFVIALAIEGKQRTSEDLALFLKNHMTYNPKNISFIIGGSNGLSQEVLTRSEELLSFSLMTFPHQIMRVILLEQIYRCFKINNNEPYHK